MSEQIAPGAHIEVRSAIWRVLKVDKANNGQQAIRAIGVSDLVKDVETIFIKNYEDKENQKGIRLLDPKKTQLVNDTSGQHIASLLHIESHLRRIPPTDDNIYTGDKAALDVMAFQQEPAKIALSKPRHRILIADAVGLGKTLSCGILLSELIARGKGKRILVVTLKSMLSQFQKEMWTRFSIPLTRLDSVGLQRIRAKIPSGQNPFYFYDRSIISIDTLKQNNRFKTYLEQSRWDVIIIDEAQNVAERGRGKQIAQRAELAKLLAKQSDSLIMLSATPHDGKSESFASLMNMLDPTAIANKSKYSPEDIKGLYVRRFKRDVEAQLKINSPERKVHQLYAEASVEEEEAFSALDALKLAAIDGKRTGATHLFKTLLEKSLLSSPQACGETIGTRLKNIAKNIEARPENAEKYEKDLVELEALQETVRAIDTEKFGKYQKLLRTLKEKKNGKDKNPFYWTGKKKNDRVLIFTERIETMRFLADSLAEDLSLEKILPDLSNINKGQLASLHGSMSDVDINRIVEDFGKEKSKIRVLVASDVASEGLNLHFLCDRLIHFDIPWSLMVFQQRNGRIDRYGQERVPHIGYMITTSDLEKIKGDQWILEKLIARDKQVQENLGDPAALTGLHSVEDEELQTGLAFANQINTDDDFDALIDLDDDDWLNDSSFDDVDWEEGANVAEFMSVFSDDYAYLKEGLLYLNGINKEKMAIEKEDTEKRLRFKMPKDLQRRYERYPEEATQKDGNLLLLGRKDDMVKAIKGARAEDSVWPVPQFLWRMHPTMDWITDKMSQNFGRHAAPIMNVGKKLAKDEMVILVSAVIPARNGHPVLHELYALLLKEEKLADIFTYQEFERKRFSLRKERFPNGEVERSEEDVARYQSLLGDAIDSAMDNILADRKQREESLTKQREEELAKMKLLEKARVEQVQLELSDKTEKREQQIRAAQAIFQNSKQWLSDALTMEDVPFVQVIAVLING